MARGSGGESVLHKHLRVLDAFDADHPYLTLGEIAGRARLARSTTHRLLAELEAEGLVERWQEDRTYRLGLRLTELAARAPGGLGLRETARPYLAQVHAVVRQHAQLGVLVGTDVLTIERFSARDAAINLSVVGGRTPLYASSLGLAMLAHARAATVDAVIAAGLHPLTDRTITTPEVLRRELARVRAQGYAVTDGHIHSDSRGIGVPVAGRHGRIQAAIGLVLPNDGANPLSYVDLLREAAAGITRAMQRL